MRVLVNCPSGESRLFQIDAQATVLELKQILQEAEGIPVKQQVLCFAGNNLKDHLSLADHNLEAYTLSDEVVLYLSKRLAAPKRVYLASRQKLSQQAAELVEADTPVGSLMGLLESRGFATQFSPGASIIVKRQDGSTVPMAVDAAEELQALEDRVAAQEGVTPSCCTFLQAQCGAMHVQVYPSASASSNTYPVYKRNAMQPIIMKKDAGEDHQPLPELVKELCVLGRGSG
ncbi:Polyubiquitin [Tetrabaena socialis]|uniref:Polyubiquitin n=1 Tax=Tetrabaena socialis TaxID=47790 RepID=A0A2J8ABD8_9CHLO|nr:Polyubiquitin [Tetrabaena socialis]|eukprot:PNH09838.1 Polyubiquitin [Tetrabaena socialis]